jgi:predicted PP-loop superfamily ATPase
MRQLPDRREAALKRVLAATEDLDVQILAAAALLAIDEHYALNCLERIHKSNAGIPSFTAEMVLREWRSGAIREYWS